LEDREGSGGITLLFSWKVNYEGGSGIRSCPEANPSTSNVDFSGSATVKFVHILTLNTDLHGTDCDIKISARKRKTFKMLGGYS
jgi:hypothetical protein